jgi:phosphinothricin acetyltransferase
MLVNIRTANETDAAFVHDVYGYLRSKQLRHLLHREPGRGKLPRKIETTLKTYPFLVCEADGVPCGFAYAGGSALTRPYRWGVEATVYLARTRPARGAWQRAYGRLLELLKRQGFKTVYGVIYGAQRAEPGAAPRPWASRRRAILSGWGTKTAGGCVVWMSKEIGIFDDTPAEPVPFSRLTEGVADAE